MVVFANQNNLDFDGLISQINIPVTSITEISNQI